MDRIIDSTKEFLIYIFIGLIIPLLGGLDNDIKILFTLTVFDIVTGILKGIKRKNLFSSKMYKGFIFKKPAIYLAIATMYQLDKSTAMQHLGFSLRTTLINGCIIMEGLSIVENLEVLGFSIPGIKNILEKSKEGR